MFGAESGRAVPDASVLMRIFDPGQNLPNFASGDSFVLNDEYHIFPFESMGPRFIQEPGWLKSEDSKC